MTQICPVINHRNTATSRDQADRELEFGADRVFLVSHNGEGRVVLQVGAQLRHAWGSTTTAKAQTV